MARVTLNWTLPDTRTNGAALPQSAISHTDISMSADGGANFSPPAEVPSDGDQKFEVDGLTFGDYIFRAVVEDNAGRRSDDADVTGTILAPPSAIADLTVTITE
jgi:hypothetical protein